MSVNSQVKTGLSAILTKNEAKIVSDWFKDQSSVGSYRGASPKESELRKECAEFIGLLRNVVGESERLGHRVPGMERCA